MSAEERIWKFLGVALTLLAIVVPTYVAYDTDDPPAPNPEKRLELVSLSGIDPLKDLSVLRNRATILVTVGDDTFDNLVIAETLLNNTGETPIVPAEYHKNLTVTVNAPWKIVTVENEGRLSNSKNIPLNWRRISDNSFEAEPALINPEDRVNARVYLTNTQFSGNNASTEDEKPKIEWNVRITNLRGFSEPPDPFAKDGHSMLDMKGIIVILYGWAVPFLLTTAVLFQAMYFYLLWRLNFFREWGWKQYGLLIGVSLISFVAAECLTTYLFEDWWTEVAGVDHQLNAPPLVLNVALLAVLWWRARPRPKSASLETG